MKNHDKTFDIINDLIKVNNDRAAGYECAGKNLRQEEAVLINVFSKLRKDSLDNIAALQVFGKKAGWQCKVGTSSFGDLHRAWIDIKSIFTKGNKNVILGECVRGDNTARSAYRKVIDANNELDSDFKSIILNQQLNMNQGYDIVKSSPQNA